MATSGGVSLRPTWWEAGSGYLRGWLSGSPRRRGIRILRYHGVVERKVDSRLERNQHLLEVFVSHVEYLRRFRILSMEELLSGMGLAETLATPAALLTFDDGFANNLLVADLLSRRRIPWCVFVPAGEIGERRAMWLVEFSLLILRGDAPRVETCGRSWPLGSRIERERAFNEMRPLLKSLPAADREKAIDEVRGQFPSGESERLLDEFPSLRSLSWPELQDLSQSGAEVGSHGLHHEMHHGLQPEAVRNRELAESKRMLEACLKRPCRVFAYPNGDFVPTSPAEAESAGYAAAFTTRSGTIEPNTERFLLPRLAAPGSLRGLVRSFWWEESSGDRAREATSVR